MLVLYNNGLNFKPFKLNGKILIYKYISSGSYGCTYKCKELESGETKVIKFFFASDSRNVISTIIREMDSMSAIHAFGDFPYATNFKEFNCIKGVYFCLSMNPNNLIELSSYYIMDYIPYTSMNVYLNYAFQYLYDIVRDYEEQNKCILQANNQSLGFVNEYMYQNSYIINNKKVYINRKKSKAYLRYILWLQIMMKNFLEILSRFSTSHICHRDIKNNNIMCDEDYNLVLIDFGLARSETVSSEQYRTDITQDFLRDPLCIVGENASHTYSDLWSATMFIFCFLVTPLENIVDFLLKNILSPRDGFLDTIKKNLVISDYSFDNNFVQFLNSCSLKEFLSTFININQLEKVGASLISETERSETKKKLYVMEMNCYNTEEIIDLNTERTKFCTNLYNYLKRSYPNFSYDDFCHYFPKTGCKLRSNVYENFCVMNLNLLNNYNMRICSSSNEIYTQFLRCVCNDIGVTKSDIETLIVISKKNSIAGNTSCDKFSKFLNRDSLQSLVNELNKNILIDFNEKELRIWQTISTTLTLTSREEIAKIKDNKNNYEADYIKYFTKILAELLVIDPEKRETSKGILQKYRQWNDSFELSDKAFKKYYHYISKEYLCRLENEKKNYNLVENKKTEIELDFKEFIKNSYPQLIGTKLEELLKNEVIEYFDK